MNNMNKCRIPFQNAETKILLKKSKTKKKKHEKHHLLGVSNKLIKNVS